MCWVAVYISGRSGFGKAVPAKLRGKYLPGSPETDNLMMVWIPDIESLRTLKIDIGSKIVFKYRLRFFTGLNEHIKSQSKSSTEFSHRENKMVEEMIEWQNSRTNN